MDQLVSSLSDSSLGSSPCQLRGSLSVYISEVSSPTRLWFQESESEDIDLLIDDMRQEIFSALSFISTISTTLPETSTTNKAMPSQSNLIKQLPESESQQSFSAHGIELKSSVLPTKEETCESCTLTSALSIKSLLRTVGCFLRCFRLCEAKQFVVRCTASNRSVA